MNLLPVLVASAVLALACSAAWADPGGIDDPAVDPVTLAPDGSRRPIIFDENFNNPITLSPTTAGPGWDTTGGVGWRTLPANGEQECYVDTSIGTVNPFSQGGGVFTISATPTASVPAQWCNQHPAYAGAPVTSYDSGIITTAPIANFLYGKVLIRAKLPGGKGIWPAFWLLPSDFSWPPEIDIMEMVGDTQQDYVSVHASDLPASVPPSVVVALPFDAAIAYHNYSVDWEADFITWSVDNTVVRQVATPPSLRVKPMYLLINLAVGGYWPGSPDKTTVFPSPLQVSHVRIWAGNP